MLVLSRKMSEGVYLRLPTADGAETEVLIRVIEVIGNRKVRLGIEAPDKVQILRDELVKDGEAQYKRKPATKAIEVEVEDELPVG